MSLLQYVVKGLIPRLSKECIKVGQRIEGKAHLEQPS